MIKSKQFEQLTQTQTILNNLFQKITKEQNRKVKDFRQYLQSNQISPCKNKSESNLCSQINDFEYHFGKQLFYVQQSPQKLSSIHLRQPSLKISNKKQKNNINSFQASQTQNALKQQNQELKRRLKNYEQQKLVLLSYQSETQFLKKVNLIQSQQIQKLRRMLRLKNESQRKNANKSCNQINLNIVDKPQSKQSRINVLNGKSMQFKKRNQTSKKSQPNSFQGSTHKKRKDVSLFYL